MKAPWPCILLAIATSSPLGWAQTQPTALPTAEAAAPAEPEAAPSGEPDPNAPAPTPPASDPVGASTGAEPAPAPAPSGPGGLFAAPPAAEASPPAPKAPLAEPAAPPRPTSSNRGHVRLGVRAGLVAPFGWVASGTRHLDVTGMGAGYGLDLSLGLSEEATLGVYGDLLVLDRVPDCATCAPMSYGAGLLVRYHLVQGLRFDPWASYGIGLIALNGVEPNGGGSYVGLEWLRLSVGGDWYGLRNLGIGPYLELGAGSFFEAPAGEEPGDIHFRFQMGVRIVLDVPGR